MSSHAAIRQAAYAANMALYEAGLVVASFGNASAIDRAAGVFAIKPSGVPYADLSPEAMVIVDLDMNVVDGNLRPSSDTNTHAVLYRAFSGVGGIAHTHSTHAVAWAQALRAIPVYGTTHADHLTVPVPCTPLMEDERIQGDYEIETGRQIVAHFESRELSASDVEMVLVGGHGPFTWGTSATKAVYHSVILEEIARMAWLTEDLNPEAQSLKDSLINKHWQRKHGEGAYYGQE
jgi:L-ribulose-5-phosphate 4-epimerase